MRCGYHPDREAVGTCARCGRGVCTECRVVVNGQNACANCAGIMSACKSSTKKEPILALLLSFFLPGLGQLYNGNTNNGLLLITATIVSWLLTSVCIGLFVFLVVWGFAMYDAYVTAEKINRGEIVPACS